MPSVGTEVPASWEIVPFEHLSNEDIIESRRFLGLLSVPLQSTAINNYTSITKCFAPACYVGLKRQFRKQAAADKGDLKMDMPGTSKRDKTFTQPVNLITTFFMVAFHIGAVAAFFFFGWKPLLSAALLWWISGSLGIGMCYHRLLTHRGYKTPKWVEYFLTVCGTLALEGGPIFWVATHRIHHQNSDKDGDPHSPQDGGFWAHMGWILTGRAMHNKLDSLLPYVPDLRKDKFHVWISEWHWVPQVVVGVLLLAFGGVPCLLWGMFVRTVFGLHCTWLVNSATHMWGTQRFITTDTSRNSFWVAILTFGEGWHNNHHAVPQSARHGLTWYEIDVNWYGIKALQTLGLAWDISLPRLGKAKEARPATSPVAGASFAAPQPEVLPQEVAGD